LNWIFRSSDDMEIVIPKDNIEDPSRNWIQTLFKWSWFPLSVQIVLLVFFALIILGSWGISTSDTKFAKILRNTNLSNLLIWSYWWPLITVTTVFFGRIWCMVCPMELVSSMASWIGFSRKAPRWLKTGWAITAFYAILLLIGVHTLAAHRLPNRMAIYMLILLGTAILCGLLFEKRAFCSYVCPVGHLLGLYAMIAPLKWTVRDQQTCKSCKTKDCVAKHNRSRLIGRSCTSNLYPATIQDNRKCLLCTQCLKACPHDNPTLAVRRPFADFFTNINMRPAQTAFVMLVVGFVVYEILSEWPTSKAIMTWLPNRVVEAFHLSGPPASLLSAFVMFVLYPVLLLMAVYLLSGFGSRCSFRKIAQSLALLLLPIMAAAHVIKALLKTTSRIPYWRYVFHDPAGIDTAKAISADPTLLDKTISLALQPAISYLAVILLVISLLAVLHIFQKSPVFRTQPRSLKVPLAFATLMYWLVFAATIYLWRF
jgi:polyferredoxin